MGTRRRTALAVGAAALVGTTAFGGIAIARDRSERLRADLTGAQEVPVADPDGDGDTRVELHVGDGEVCFRVRFDDTGTPNRGHIHIGAAGVNGGIVVPFFELAGMPADARNDALEKGRIEGCVPASEEVLAAIADNPEGYYVNLHNARFPAGAIRGQLED